MGKVNPIPAGIHTVTPSIVVKDSKKAIAFYKKAFNAKNEQIMEHNGKVMHADIVIGNSHVMMCDEMPEMKCFSADTLGGSPVCLYIYTENADALYKQAISAGAKSMMEPVDMFWGDRFSSVMDPFGLQWSILTHIEDVSHEEALRRGEKFFSKSNACAPEKK